ncbi:MAG: hypothetical protein K8W52_16050 [Deltaproteobacteria bacterium]|nr:hypothetical protein [Deltaproteobacteria bacterium]
MSAPTTGVGWTVARVLAWIEQLEAGLDKMSLFDLLEIPPTASLTHVRQGFHAIAITRHPDVWRNRLSPSQLDHLVRVYGRVAAAYATLREPDERTRYLRNTRDSQPGIARPGDRAPRDSNPMMNRPATAPERAARESVPAMGRPISATERTARDSVPSIAVPPVDRARPDSRPPATVPRATTATGAPPRASTATGAPAASALGARAQGYFRRAEAAARIGDIAAAVLNLRLAIAAEPTSAFLRNALAAAQAELAK